MVRGSRAAPWWAVHSRMLLESGAEIELIPAESFVDAVLDEVGHDHGTAGCRSSGSHHLPRSARAGQADHRCPTRSPGGPGRSRRSRRAGTPRRCADRGPGGPGCLGRSRGRLSPDGVDSALAGYRTSIFIDNAPGGLIEAVRTMTTLCATVSVGSGADASDAGQVPGRGDLRAYRCGGQTRFRRD